MGAEKVPAPKPLLIGDTSKELCQSEMSSEEVLEGINKICNNKKHRKAMVLTQEFSTLLLKY